MAQTPRCLLHGDPYKPPNLGIVPSTLMAHCTLLMILLLRLLPSSRLPSTSRPSIASQVVPGCGLSRRCHDPPGVDRGGGGGGKEWCSPWNEARSPGRVDLFGWSLDCCLSLGMILRFLLNYIDMVLHVPSGNVGALYVICVYWRQNSPGEDRMWG